jgi:histidinol-phosphatase (PHP family)
MPWFSYHSAHSGQFCRHAKGTLEAVVVRAIELGFSHYGLSEHCPRYRPEDLFEDEADLTPADTETIFQDYAREALRLRDAYADRIELLVGFETERLPPESWPQTMAALRRSAAFEYVIGSVHDVDGVSIDYTPERTNEMAERCGGREALQIRYFEALTELVATLRPEVIGHIDLIRKFDGEGASFSPAVWPAIEGVLDAAREAGSVLDVNSGAYRRGLSPVYPLPAILDKARAMGVGVTLGDDGHGAHDVGAGLDACMKAITDADYREVHFLARVEGRVTLCAAPIEEVGPRR